MSDILTAAQVAEIERMATGFDLCPSCEVIELCASLRHFVELLRDRPIICHSEHWDSQGTRGANCSACEKERRYATRTQAALAAWDGEKHDDSV